MEGQSKTNNSSMRLAYRVAKLANKFYRIDDNIFNICLILLKETALFCLSEYGPWFLCLKFCYLKKKKKKLISNLHSF